MNKLASILIGGICLSFSSCLTATAQKQIIASKQHVTREVKVGSFDHIQLNGSSEIIFTPTEGQQHLELTVPDNMEDIVRVYVKDRTLVMEMKSHTSVIMKNGSRVKLRISAPMVESTTLNGSGDITFPASVNAQNPLEVTLNGSGDIDFRNIRASSLKATVNGSGDISLGEVAAARIHTAVNGSGDLTIAAVNASETYATVNGSGDIKITDILSQTVDGSVSGSGDLELSGRTENAHYLLAGSGDISAARLKAKQVTAHVAHGSGDIHCHASESIVMTQRRNGDSITYTGNPKRIERTNH